MIAETKFYLIHCQTNLHVGSGDSNYGVIDKLVQRDPSDGMPCINATSLKGAFREYYEENIADKPMADELFGASEDRNGNNASGNNRSSHIIHDGLLLSIPARSNHRPYFMATAPIALNKLARFIKLFGEQKNLANVVNEVNLLLAAAQNLPLVLDDATPSLRIEGHDIGTAQFNNGLSLPTLTALLGGPIVLFPDNDFQELCDDYNLPIVARNCLENGKSTNLWYEQIIPREARFFFPSNFYDLHGKQNDYLFQYLNTETVQIGANSSVGYGYCRIDEFTELLSPKTN